MFLKIKKEKVINHKQYEYYWQRNLYFNEISLYYYNKYLDPIFFKRINHCNNKWCTSEGQGRYIYYDSLESVTLDVISSYNTYVAKEKCKQQKIDMVSKEIDNFLKIQE